MPDALFKSPNGGLPPSATRNALTASAAITSNTMRERPKYHASASSVSGRDVTNMLVMICRVGRPPAGQMATRGFYLSAGRGSILRRLAAAAYR